MSSEKYIGLDVHQATISVAVMDSQGTFYIYDGAHKTIVLAKKLLRNEISFEPRRGLIAIAAAPVAVEPVLWFGTILLSMDHGVWRM